MKTYALCIKQLANDEYPEVTFTFQSKNLDTARTETARYMIRHGMTFNDAVIRPAVNAEFNLKLHNEYL